MRLSLVPHHFLFIVLNINALPTSSLYNRNQSWSCSHLFLSENYFPFLSLSYTNYIANMKKMLTLFMFILVQLVVVNSRSPKHSSPKPNAKITVMGFVYCDVCSNNTFSKHSYFMSGVEVRIVCSFKAASSTTGEMLTFSANRTTNEYGIYKVSITSLECVEADNLATSCQASLIGTPRSSDSTCNVPGYRTTTDQVLFKSKRSNLCIYGFNALNFRPFRKDLALCGKK